MLSRSTSEDVEARIKVEENERDGEAWRRLPMVKGKEEQGSPLSEKKGHSHSQTHSHSQRQSGREDIGKLGGEAERDRGAAIRRHAQARREQKALLAGSSAASAPSTGRGNRFANADGPEEELNDAVEKLSVFDGPSSSPATLANGHTGAATGAATSESVVRKELQPSSSKDGAHGMSTAKRRAPSTTGIGNASSREIGAGGAANRRHSLAPPSSSTTLPLSASTSTSASISTSNPHPRSVTALETGPRNPPLQLSRSRSTAGALSDKLIERDGVAGGPGPGVGGLRRSVSVSASVVGGGNGSNGGRARGRGRLMLRIRGRGWRKEKLRLRLRLMLMLRMMSTVPV